jgi:hypothetical protein
MVARTELVELDNYGESGTILFMEWSHPVLIRLLLVIAGRT